MSPVWMRMRLYRRLLSCLVTNPKYFYYVGLWKDHERTSKRLKDGAIPENGSFLPSKLDLRITYRCNLRCKMCGQWGLTGTYFSSAAKKKNKQLELDDLRPVIGELLPRGLRFVDMEGGETFLHPQVLDILAFLKRNRLIVKPVTNGTVLARYAKDLVALGLDAIVVSIDGDRSTHNRIRGRSWAFDRALEGIRALRKERMRQRKRLPFVQVSYTTSRHNGAGGLRGLVRDLLCEGESLVDVLVVKASPIFVPSEAGEAYRRLIQKYFGIACGISAWEGFKEDYREFGAEASEIAHVLSEIRKQVLPFCVEVVPRIDPRDVPRLYVDYAWTLGRSHCPVPWVEPTIDADGNVYPCNLFTDESLSMGNIHEQPFLDIWHGDLYRRFRSMLAEQKKGLLPICNRCCQFTEH